MAKPLHTVAYTPSFLTQAKDEGMTAVELAALEKLLSQNPMAGDMIVGSGGCRKVRIARQGGGKSGGFRVVTYFAAEDRPVYAFAVLAKNSRANFTEAEVAAMAAVAKAIKAGAPTRRPG